MRTWQGRLSAAAAFIAGVAPVPAWCYSSDYTYVRMSLAVPWALYFVFLAGVLIPFVVMVVLAWRGAARSEPAPEAPAIAEPESGAP